jgi:hypothetical protein
MVDEPETEAVGVEGEELTVTVTGVLVAEAQPATAFQDMII